MADPVTKDPVDKDEPQRGATISNAGPPIPDETPETPVVPASAEAANTNSATAEAPKPNPKDTRVIPKAPSQDTGGDAQPAGNDQPAAEPSENVKAIKSVLSLKYLDPHMEEMLRDARPRLGKDGQSVLIDLPTNGHCLHCGKSREGVEFIGLPNKKMMVDEHDAHIMVGLAKGRGWRSINVDGNDHEKELVWLEAMRQGVNVANFRPDPNSAVYKTWMTEYADQPQATVTEAKPVDYHIKTMQLLQIAADHAGEPDVKKAFEGVLKKYQDGAALGTKETFKTAGAALGNKATRDTFNAMIEALNKVDPKLGLTKLDPPAAQPQPAAKADVAPKPA
jgi:hypothetical protein